MIGILQFKNELTGEWQALEVIRGERGPIGETGATGATGPAGYTPIKGIDYFDGETGPVGPQGPKGDPYVLTQEDIDTITNAVLASFPVAEEVKW